MKKGCLVNRSNRHPLQTEILQIYIEIHLNKNANGLLKRVLGLTNPILSFIEKENSGPELRLVFRSLKSLLT